MRSFAEVSVHFPSLLPVSFLPVPFGEPYFSQLLLGAVILFSSIHKGKESFPCCLPCNLHPIPLAFWRWVLSFKVCKYSFYSIPSFHSFSIFCFQFLNWYILLAYVFFVSSIATAANRNITTLSDGIEVLILVRLYVVKQKCTTWAPIKFGALI